MGIGRCSNAPFPLFFFLPRKGDASVLRPALPPLSVPALRTSKFEFSNFFFFLYSVRATAQAYFFHLCAGPVRLSSGHSSLTQNLSASEPKRTRQRVSTNRSLYRHLSCRHLSDLLSFFISYFQLFLNVVILTASHCYSSVIQNRRRDQWTFFVHTLAENQQNTRTFATHEADDFLCFFTLFVRIAFASAG